MVLMRMVVDVEMSVLDCCVVFVGFCCVGIDLGKVDWFGGGFVSGGVVSWCCFGCG